MSKDPYSDQEELMWEASELLGRIYDVIKENEDGEYYLGKNLHDDLIKHFESQENKAIELPKRDELL